MRTYYAALMRPDYFVEISVPVKANDQDEAARIFFTARMPRIPAFFFLFAEKTDPLDEGRVYHAREIDNEIRLTIAYDAGKSYPDYWPGLDEPDPKEDPPA